MQSKNKTKTIKEKHKKKKRKSNETKPQHRREQHEGRFPQEAVGLFVRSTRDTQERSFDVSGFHFLNEKKNNGRITRGYEQDSS